MMEQGSGITAGEEEPGPFVIDSLPAPFSPSSALRPPGAHYGNQAGMYVQESIKVRAGARVMTWQSLFVTFDLWKISPFYKLGVRHGGMA